MPKRDEALRWNFRCATEDPILRPQSHVGSVLLSHDIEYCALAHEMIVPFKSKNLKPAGIYLSLGSEYSLGGKIRHLKREEGEDELTIPPFEVVIISTEELINLPRFIIARWNLRVTYVYKGLLWTGALQVDPGWYGKLYCPIYNLPSEPVTLKVGDPIVLMDFVLTTPFVAGRSKEYERPPKRRSLRDYGNLTSALYTKAGLRLDESEKKIARIESLTALSFAAMAVLFAALAILVTSGNVTTPPKEALHPFFIIWPIVSVAISLLALTISVVRGEFRTKWFRIPLCLFFIIFSLLFAVLAFPIAKTGISSLLGFN